jgi:YnbE-like lipoprotein
MICEELTNRARAATVLPMQGIASGNRRSRQCSARALLMLLSGLALSGCVSVNAPDKPIVIELNINIRQEVIYRLAADAAKTIDQNADIF